jgi:AbrB family looped-hinge helix DNA binding protein
VPRQCYRTVRIDKNGRILIPKELRDKAGMKDSAEVKLEQGRIIIIKANHLHDNIAKYTTAFTTKDLSKLGKMSYEQALKEV